MLGPAIQGESTGHKIPRPYVALLFGQPQSYE